MNITLTHYKIEFGFGVGKDRHQNVISASKISAALRVIQTEAAKRFGGYTLVATDGGWINPAGLLIKEHSFTLFTVIEASPTSGAPIVAKSFATFIGGVLDQEAVAITITPVYFHMQFCQE